MSGASGAWTEIPPGEWYALPGYYQLGGSFNEQYGSDVAEYVNQMRPAASAFFKDGSVFVTVKETLGLDASDLIFTGEWRRVEKIPGGSAGLALAGAAFVAFLLLGKR